MKAIVLFSGGQDSTTCLFWALQQFESVEAIGFDYGQKHKKELEQAAKIAKIAQVKFNVLNIEGLLSGSSLTDHSKDVNDAHEKNAELPSSFTAGRNALFLSIAASYGYGKDVFDIVTGTCQTDYSGYPDCRRTFVDSQQLTSSLAMDKDFRIHTPLMYLTKSETWRLASDLTNSFIFESHDGYITWENADFKITGLENPTSTKEDTFFNVLRIVRDMTLTDYNGDMTMNDWGMGKADNPASVLRKKGFNEAKAKGWI